MNIADKVNTVLDLSGYNSLGAQFDPTNATDLVALLGVVLAIGGVIILFVGLITVSYKAKMLVKGGITGMVLGGFLMAFCFLFGDVHNPVVFSDYVNKAYGFESSNLPDGKPEDGCLSVTWEKDGEIHSGTLNLLDNKISIKEIGGDYLEVTEQASQKNGE